MPPRSDSNFSNRCFYGQSDFITQPRQILFNLRFQFVALFKLFFQLRGEARHFIREQFTVVFLFGGADVAAGGEDVVVLFYFVQRGGFAEPAGVCSYPYSFCRLPVFANDLDEWKVSAIFLISSGVKSRRTRSFM